MEKNKTENKGSGECSVENQELFKKYIQQHLVTDGVIGDTNINH